MEELSDEHLLRIFAFLDVRSLSLSQRVCRRWQGLSDDYTLWRSLCYALRLAPDLPRVFTFSPTAHLSSSSSSLPSLSSSSSAVPFQSTSASSAATLAAASTEGIAWLVPASALASVSSVAEPADAQAPHAHAAAAALQLEFLMDLVDDEDNGGGEEEEEGEEGDMEEHVDEDDGEEDEPEARDEEADVTHVCAFMSKADFKLARFGFDSDTSNWKKLYRRLRTQSSFVSAAFAQSPHPRMRFPLASAIDAASPGEFVYVLPGVYHGDRGGDTSDTLQITKAVSMIGLGRTADDVIVKIKNSHFLRSWSVAEVGSSSPGDGVSNQLIKNITFMGCSNHAICIGEGSHVVLENCRFTNTSRASYAGSATAVNIYGFNTHPTLKNCLIYSSTKHGVFVGECAEATLENVEIAGTEHSGIHVRSSGHVNVEGGKIHHCKHHGVLVNKGAGASIRNCEIYNVQGEAIERSAGSKEIVAENINVHDCLGKQVGGTTSAEDCSVM